MADRARAWLSRLGLGHVGLDDRVGRLSGGEAVLTALAALFLRRPPVIVLDEPTNNLDLDARRRLYAAVESWPGVMLIVSHDRELLALMDQIAELTGRPGRAGRQVPRRLAAHVRREPRGVRGAAGDRTGRGAARGHRGRGRTSGGRNAT